MKRFTILESTAVPIDQANLDTDQIIPARFLKNPREGGFSRYLFHDLRFNTDGSTVHDFSLNQQRYHSASILVARQNFGCGSSREAAVWALYDYGIRAVIAPSVGDIFRNNSLKNGLVPITLPLNAVDDLFKFLAINPDHTITVDLMAQLVVLPPAVTLGFHIDTFVKECLLSGVDEIEYTLSKLDEIANFERRYERDV